MPGRARFTLKRSSAADPSRKPAKKLHGYGAIQARVTDFVYLAHAAGPQKFSTIRSDALSRGEPHV
jgi:hypothetical protein